MLFRTILAASVLLPSIALAEVSPYAGQQSRPIKALSQEQLDGLLQGKGMSLALPAELNSYPGPTHAIDLAAELGLSPEQVEKLEQIRNEMSAEAKGLGAEIVEQERGLDEIFARGTAAAEKVDALAQSIGELQGRLRAVHLKAHLEVRRVLTADQVHRYDVLRGYTGSPPAKAHGAGDHAH